MKKIDPFFLLNQINKSYFRKDLPLLEVGDKIEVISKILKKEKTKFSSFKGIIISQKRKNQISHTFTVLQESNKLIIQQTFFYHSPLIEKIKKTGRINQKIRRAKLYFLARRLAEKKARE